VLVLMHLLHNTSSSLANEDDYHFSLTDLASGEIVTLEDLTIDLPLVVHVWGPDCPYCRTHMPYADALYKKLDPAEVSFVAFSITGEKDEITDYLDEHELEFRVLVLENGEYGPSYEEQGWPTTFVFAPGGEFVGWCDTVGPAYITQMLELIAEAGGSTAALARDPLGRP
jgi:thiol-disulfide isomerase/thioredoxin